MGVSSQRGRYGAFDLCEGIEDGANGIFTGREIGFSFLRAFRQQFGGI